MGFWFPMGVALRHLDFQQGTAGRVFCSQHRTLDQTVLAIERSPVGTIADFRMFDPFLSD
jgi:hypothetical protein